ncbi:MAG: hypothetical protein AAGJ87_10690 [Pseudomonadota bacterium]
MQSFAQWSFVVVAIAMLISFAVMFRRSFFAATFLLFCIVIFFASFVAPEPTVGAAIRALGDIGALSDERVADARRFLIEDEAGLNRRQLGLLLTFTALSVLFRVPRFADAGAGPSGSSIGGDGGGGDGGG